MPPHVTEMSYDGTIRIRGYSLGYCDLDAELSLVDAQTGEAVPLAYDLKTEMVGKRGGPPGSVQARSDLVVTPTEPLTSGRAYRLELLGDVLDLTG